MGYKVIGEDDRGFRIQHHDGSEFSVAKKGLDKATISRIKAMPSVQKFDTGGDVAPIGGNPADPNNLLSLATPEVRDQAAADRAAADAANFQQQSSAGLTTTPYDEIPPAGQPAGYAPAPTPVPDTPPPQSVANPTPPTTPADMQAQADAINSLQAPKLPTGAGQLASNNPTAGMLQGYQEMKKGLAGNADATKNAADANVRAQDESIQQLKDLAAKADEARKPIEDENNQLYQSLKSGKIDPNRYWSSMSTGNKIGASIALILGGLGAANGQGNAAVKVLQSSIDKDIDAQKAAMGKNENLLSSNYAKLRDMSAAESKTRLDLLTVAKAQMDRNASQLQSDSAKNNYLIQRGTIDNQISAIKQQMALYQAKQQVEGAGVTQLSPAVLQDKDMAASIVHDPVTNKFYKAYTPDDAKELKTTIGAYSPLINTLNQIKSLGTVVPGSDSYAKAQTLGGVLVTEANKLHDMKRLSAEDVSLMQGMADDPTSLRQMFSRGTRTNELMNRINDEFESEKKARIPNYRGPSVIDFKPRGS